MPRLNTDYERAGIAAERAIKLSARSRETARTTRLRIRLEEIRRSLTLRAKVRDSGRLLEEVLDAVMAAADAPMGNLQLNERGTLWIKVQRGFKRPFLEFFNAVHEGEAACGVAFRQGAPVVVEHVEQSPIYSAAARQAMLEAGARAVQSLPLLSGGKKLGIVSVHYPVCGIPKSSQEALASLASDIAVTVDRCIDA